MSGGDNNAEIVVAAAALVVSVIAFGATLMQCLQQYYASARGYSQCNEKVMGTWAGTKTRVFSWEELRFEVQFHAPVIFVCPPNNDKGPVPEEEVYMLDGTPESLENTWSTLNMSQRKDYEDRNTKGRIHTSDNERASWTILLSAVHLMERESREWQIKEFAYEERDTPPQNSLTQHGLPAFPPSLDDNHTLVVALQRKRRSWDTMPTSITKPYATTTMCHLVELLAAMGVYWKVFDRTSDRYRAEGNGLMILGDRVSDLGLMFSVQVNGRSRFTRNRVIPVDEIKELCFGRVPTIYRSVQDERRLEPIDVLDLSSLQIGTRAEIAETLTMIGCNNNAIKCFKTGERFSHLFSLSFEILAMLSQTLHIPNTLYTYLPNPTSDHWDNKAVSLHKLMCGFRIYFSDDLPDRLRNSVIVDRIKAHLDNIIKYPRDGNVEETLLRFKALHAALNDTDEILTGRKRKDTGPAVGVDQDDPHAQDDVPETTLERIGTFFAGSRITQPSVSKPIPKKKGPKVQPSGLNEETEKQQRRREMVQDVLRSHIQEVLRLLNEPEERKDQQTLRVPEQHTRGRSTDRGMSPSVSSQYDDAPNFEDMDDASPDDRQHIMMEVYFKQIRRLVVPHATRSTDNRRAGRINSPSGRQNSNDSRVEVMTPVVESPARETPGVPGVPVARSAPQSGGRVTEEDIPLTNINTEVKNSKSYDFGKVVESPLSEAKLPKKLPSLAEENVHHDDVWCTLVFRMICWLMLHEFNKFDKLVVKSELLGSRMPVYIS